MKENSFSLHRLLLVDVRVFRGNAFTCFQDSVFDHLALNRNAANQEHVNLSGFQVVRYVISIACYQGPIIHGKLHHICVFRK